MNWIKSSLSFGFVGVIAVWATACGSAGAVPATPTALPTPIVQVTPSLTPIPRSPTPLPTATVSPSRTAVPAVSPSRTAVPTVTFTPTANPKDLAQAAFTKALANLKTYRVEVPQENRYIAVQLPDRFLQEGEDSVIKIGGTLWMASIQGYRIGTGTPPYFERADINWYKQQFAQASQVVLLGPGTAEGVACIGYSINLTVTKAEPPKTPGATPATSQVAVPIKIWFATTDGFPRRVDIAAPLSLTVNFFDFNDNFTITPPQ